MTNTTIVHFHSRLFKKQNTSKNWSTVIKAVRLVKLCGEEERCYGWGRFYCPCEGAKP